MSKNIEEILDLYDKECRNIYGDKTCIIFQKDIYNYHLRLMDILEDTSLYHDSLYRVIPKLLKSKYIVIIVEEVIHNDTKINTITGVHFPEGSTALMAPAWPWSI